MVQVAQDETNPETRSAPAIRQTARSLPIDGRAERVMVSASGRLVIFGWLADCGAEILDIKFEQAGEAILCSGITVSRHKREDVRAAVCDVAYDFGFLLVVKLGSQACLGHAMTFEGSTLGRTVSLRFEPTIVSDHQMLDALLSFLGDMQAHQGHEFAIRRFLNQGGKDHLAALNEAVQGPAARVQHVERLRPGQRGPSFMTVLFGSAEAVMFQPLLFAKAGVSFGEWIYVCNSPDQAASVIRSARTFSDLYGLAITVVVMGGNAGFGAANNAAMNHASSSGIVLINPDVHVIPSAANMFNLAMDDARFGTKMRGGLLFYDEQTLMHGGMFLDDDPIVTSAPIEHEDKGARLLRVEHYDKGVPFLPQQWGRPREVPAVTGAFMAFDRALFEKIGGFSREFIYGHYEDADLCLRWADAIGSVEVDPHIRLVHLEGQGSKTRAPQFHGAAIVNRYLFTDRNLSSFKQSRARSSHAL